LIARAREGFSETCAWKIASARLRAFENGFAMADALAVHCCPLEETGTPNDCCEWVAECEINGRRFVARSREGVIYELARILAAAGIEDRPLCVTFAGVAAT
jgi:hypothetical protein